MSRGVCALEPSAPRALVEGPLLGSLPGAPAGRAEQEGESRRRWRLCFWAGVCPTPTAASGR